MAVGNKKITRVNHGTWSHAGKQDRNCETCKAGIGWQTTQIKLKPLK